MLNTFAILTLFLPLFGFIVTNLIKNKNKYGPYICTISLIGSFLSCMALVISLGFGSVHHIHLWTWFKVGDLKANWGLFLDALSLTMFLVVTLISSLVHVYSFGYMHNDKHIGKFFSYLSLFTFSMLVLVSAPNLLQLFVGWEGVGLASYLLIGFWYEKESASFAAMKAFIVNRVGDVGLVAAIGFLFFAFNSLDFTVIFSKILSSTYFPKTIHFFCELPTVELIAFCLLFGAMGKSAQFGLHTWLPDAMEGPTPVSALIHAATMVTAGIFLICRFSSLFELAPCARSIMLVVGALTSLFAASVALTQTDIKRIIAYSTCSQLGYMIMACAVSAYSIAMFHLVTHAFFKALLFLGAGSVIHAMSGEQDITKMGGLYKLIPFTFAVMMIGSLALAGIPFFAGFFSKDAIIEAIYISPFYFAKGAFVIAIFVAFLTAFYSWRLLVITFHKEASKDEYILAHIHESPVSMKIPLIILSIGAIFSGFLGKAWYMDQALGFKWGSALAFSTVCHPHVPLIIEYIPLVVAILGIALGYLFYLLYTYIPAHLSKGKLYKFSYHKWYMDEFYQITIVKPLQKIGTFLWIAGDQTCIDSLGPDGSAKFILKGANKVRVFATGRINHMVLGFVLLLLCMLSAFYIKGTSWVICR